MTKYLYLLIILCTAVSFSFAQDSYQKESLLNARKRASVAKANRENCSKLGLEAAFDNRCVEFYPTEVMTWGKGFSDGLAKVTVDGKAGFIDSTGKLVIPAKYSDAGEFNEGLAPFENSKGKWGYINSDGKTAIPAAYDWAISFHEGLGLVQVGKLWGFIDRNGKIVIEPKFEEASSFQEGFAVVGFYADEGKWQRNFIDKTGNVKFSTPFDGISRNFDGGMAIVSRSLGYSEKFKGSMSETYIIDTTGEELWKLDSWFVSWFSDDVIVVAAGEDSEGKDTYSFVDRTGKRMTNKTFSRLAGFSEGLSGARVTWTGKEGFIDKAGDFVIEPKFDWTNSFSEGLAGVKDAKGYGFIDRSGNWVIEPQFEWVGDFQEGFALIAPKGDLETREKTGYIDRTGKFIWKPTK